MADEQGPGIDTNPGPRNADRGQRGLRELFQVSVLNASNIYYYMILNIYYSKFDKHHYIVSLGFNAMHIPLWH